AFVKNMQSKSRKEMSYKHAVLSLISLFLSYGIDAQIVTLQKNNSLKTTILDPSKRISLDYKSDSCLIVYKGRINDYMFPYLVLRRKNDTLVLDVRRIERMRFTSNTLSLNYIGIFLV